MSNLLEQFEQERQQERDAALARVRAVMAAVKQEQDAAPTSTPISLASRLFQLLTGGKKHGTESGK